MKFGLTTEDHLPGVDKIKHLSSTHTHTQKKNQLFKQKYMCLSCNIIECYRLIAMESLTGGFTKCNYLCRHTVLFAKIQPFNKESMIRKNKGFNIGWPRTYLL
jgi:hypothetical protein